MTKTATTTVTMPKEVKEGLTFIRKSDKSKLPELLAELNIAVEKLNGVANGDDVTAIREAQDGVNTALETYNKHKTLCDYEDFAETPNPMKAALVAGYITLKKVISVDMLGVTAYSVEDAEMQIDFIAFNGISGHLMGAKTQLIASQLGYMTLLAKGEKDGNSVAEITAAYQKAKNKPITKVFKKAPSKNELKAALQELIDSIYFEDNGSGKNKFMVTSEWLHWFTDNINRTYYGKGVISRSAKSVKQIIQSAAALYNAYFNKYGIRTAVDKDNFVTGSVAEETEKPKATKKTAKKATKKTSKKAAAPAEAPTE